MADANKYKDTLNLPQTEFPMRASLATREPEMLAAWKQMDLYGRIQQARADAPRYLLHDGPPYANGAIHYGHILNKILKDLVVKSKTMAGFRAPYVPGWDCHGLPIEHAVGEELGARARDMSKLEIRQACRDYAHKYIDIQREGFERLGVFGTWDAPYLTLNHGYEATIVRALAAFARGGYLYRGKKPVYWCPRCRTALAEAEIEYEDHRSPSIYVAMKLTEAFDAGKLHPELAGARVALPIWTTTPWTLPANLAIVLHPELPYVAIPDGRGGWLLAARELAGRFAKAARLAAGEAEWLAIDQAALRSLEGARYHHPFLGAPRADNDFKVWFADYVTTEQGTGLVHTAPGHGAEDYDTGVKHGLEPYAPIDDAGRYTDEAPEAWRGMVATDANPHIIAKLHEVGALLNGTDETVSHSYAHCWRCKGPILYRATPQWFARIDHNDLRGRALAEIDNTEWVPPWGRNRIHGMIENRPDWVLSRQRVWGVPIPVFHCDACDQPLVDATVMEHVADVFAEHGADAWYSRPASELLPEGAACGGCGGRDLRPEQNIVDVWFESGVSWLAVCAPNPELGDVDMYLEGSDQHRGWFHSSLLTGIAVQGKAPYKTVLTHGFVLDEHGAPYSKSEIAKAAREGKKISYIPPEKVLKENGAELFRLWVASTEFRNDIPYSQAILSGLTDWYRKFRNTCRFMLGNLQDFEPDNHHLDEARLQDIDVYALARLGDLAARVRDAYDAFEFHVVFRALVDYVATDLSAVYLDVVKDRLYSDAADSESRRAAQTVLYSIARTLAEVTAPILCFTAEDVWRHLPRRLSDPESVHLARMPAGKRMDEGGELATRWAALLRYREGANKSIEAFRAEKNKSLDARVVITPLAADRALLAGRLGELADLMIVSQVALADGDAPGDQAQFAVTRALGIRCARCWKWVEQPAPENPELCPRCHAAVSALQARKG